MHLQSYRLKNYRRLRDVHVELSKDISIFVGANNSGKTSATDAIRMLLSGRKDQLSLFDFSSYTWKLLNELGAADPAGDATAVIPSIALDLWFQVSEADLYLVLPILPSTAWQGTEVGIRIEFAARNQSELLSNFRKAKAEAVQQAAALADAGSYVPWPKSLTAYLEKELHREFEFRYSVLDRAQFDVKYVEQEGSVPMPITGTPGGGAILDSLVKVDCLHAQRHLADANASSGGGAGRAEDLSRRLSRFYERNLEQRPDDHSALKALSDSEEGLNKHLMDVFGETLDRIAKLGYPGLNNPRLEIKSGLNPATVMSQDAKVHYVLGDGEGAVRLPDSYNGLGFKNLIYMVVEILDVQEKWKALDERPPLHLIFIEEPEAHLHAQLQQVFIRNVLGLLEIDGEKDSAFASQVVATTHSPHILYERGFRPIRYFRRHVTEGEQTTEVLNLSTFQAGTGQKDKDFLQRYLKLTHCDLFFADAAILVEGNVERLLLPLMIEKEAKELRSAALSILEVGGAFGHRFRELIQFLGITTLIITDLDSVEVVAAPAGQDDDEEEEKEFEVPSAEPGGEPQRKYGKTCLPSEAGAVTANQTLIQWLPKRLTIDDLRDATATDKIESITGTEKAMVRVAYQVPTEVTWGGSAASICGRTLEESFGLENAVWCQDADRKPLGLKLRGQYVDPAALALGLHKRVTSSNFDKTKFALGVLTRKEEDWNVPLYIKEGLEWLSDLVDLEASQEIAAAAEGQAVEAVAEPATDLNP